MKFDIFLVPWIIWNPREKKAKKKKQIKKWMEFNYRNDALVGRHNANSVPRRVHKALFMGELNTLFMRF